MSYPIHEKVPTNFYELELNNPKRNTGFAGIAKNLLNLHPEKRINRLQFEEELIVNDEQKKEKELKFYQGLVKKFF